jgi:hypothetical protein
MSYEYSFDETDGGRGVWRRNDYLLIQESFRILLSEIEKWNKSALEHGASRKPYENEYTDIEDRIAWGDKQLAEQNKAFVEVEGISVGSLRYIKAALLFTVRRKEQDVARKANEGWPDGVLSTFRERINKIKKLADKISYPPSDILWELMPKSSVLETANEQQLQSQEMLWDVFISHASEDKEGIVRKLTAALLDAKLEVWYDELTLKVGDSLRRSIDRGLAHSRYGIVVISPAFLNKEWPKKELDGLVALEADGRQRILPVWHEIEADDVRKYSPILADRIATSSKKGLNQVVVDLLDVIRPEGQTTQSPVISDKSTMEGDHRLVDRELSGDKTRLKEECEAILDGGNLREWQGLVDELWRDIPNRMLEWKPKAERTWYHDSGDLDPLRLEAVEICLPSIVPILVAVEKGRNDYWEIAAGSLRQLALLRDQMGGGVLAAVEIGCHMLYFAGSLGMALAVETKQLDLVDKWMRLPMPAIRYLDKSEQTWASTSFAHRRWGKYIPNHREPFADIIKICELEYLSAFFPNKDKLVNHLFLANLSQSLFEMGRCVEDGECLKSLEALDKRKFEFELDVWPIWALMNQNDFKSSTWELFGSSKGVHEFVFGRGLSLEKLWEWWKKWKEICCHSVMQSAVGKRGPLMVRPDFLILPGEPMS